MRIIVRSTLLLVGAWFPTLAYAQQTLDYPSSRYEAYRHSSGPVVNEADVAGSKHQHVVRSPGASWLRLHFSDVELKKGSLIRVTSMLDHDTQLLDQAALAQWGNTSAYFNGDAVTVELIADARSKDNRFTIYQVERELDLAEPRGGSGQCGICGATDDRVPSSETWACRLLPAGCTASVWNEDSCLVSAGHCMGGNMVIQFNVPNSQPNCSIVSPPVADQFPITSFLSSNNGVGDDWSVLTAGTNNLGQLPYERYGTLRPIAAAPAGVGQTAEMNGYGVDLTCIRSQTQQFASGPITQVFSSYFRYDIDLRGGNSGSSLIRDDEIIGIATHCPCSNYATRADLSEFATARSVLCGNFPPPPNNDCADAIAFNGGAGDGVMAFSTLGATTDGPVNPSGVCSDSGQPTTGRDIWYTYEAVCTGDLTVTTCDDVHGAGGPSYDSDLVIYGPYDDEGAIDCGGAALSAKRLGCNDDDTGHPCGTAPPWASNLVVPVTQGKVYLLRVGGWSEGDAGDGFLGVFCNGVTVTGACCFTDGSCQVLRPTQCADAVGTYDGDGTACLPNPCPQPCGLLGDINQDLGLDGLDVAGFTRAKLGLAPEAGENQACANYGTGTLSGDTDLFVEDLLGP